MGPESQKSSAEANQPIYSAPTTALIVVVEPRLEVTFAIAESSKPADTATTNIIEMERIRATENLLSGHIIHFIH